MNIYARIRRIEDHLEFKRLVDTILGAEYGARYQATKDWHDFGVDGYQRESGTVYAVYCPRYPERAEIDQYRRKIHDDINRLKASIAQGKFTRDVNNWTFVTPDDLTQEIIEYMKAQAEDPHWETTALTAQVLAPLFMKHSEIHPDFPMITAGLQLDKIPSIDAHFAKNREYPMLELFNDGTEDLRNLKIAIKNDDGGIWTERGDHFMFEFDNPVMGSTHSLFNLRKGERQYCRDLPTAGGFSFRVTGVGVESGKTFVKEGNIPKRGEKA